MFHRGLHWASCMRVTLVLLIPHLILKIFEPLQEFSDLLTRKFSDCLTQIPTITAHVNSSL